MSLVTMTTSKYLLIKTKTLKSDQRPNPSPTSYLTCNIVTRVITINTKQGSMLIQGANFFHKTEGSDILYILSIIH